MKMKRNALSLLILLGLSTGTVGTASAGGIPVLDVSNLAQSTVSALEAVQQTIKQVEQYALQVQQWENEVKNTLAPAAYIWSKAQKTMSKAQDLQGQLNSYSTMGQSDLERHLSKFGNVNYYKDSENFGPMEASQTREKTIAASKNANDEATKTLAYQYKAVADDAHELEQLQVAAQSASGRMEAIQYSNQLMAHQSNQLLQLRSTLLAISAAENAQLTAQNTEAAMKAASMEKYLKGVYEKSEKRQW